MTTAVYFRLWVSCWKTTQCHCCGSHWCMMWASSHVYSCLHGGRKMSHWKKVHWKKCYRFLHFLRFVPLVVVVFFLVSPVSLLFACYLGLSKLCRLSSTFAIMSRSVRNIGLVVWIWAEIFWIHIIWQLIACLLSSLFNVNTCRLKGSEFYGVNIIILYFETISGHRILLLRTGIYLRTGRNLPHLKMHLLYKTKEEDEERIRTSLFAGIKTVQPRRQRSVLYFVFVCWVLEFSCVCVFVLPSMMQFFYEYIRKGIYREYMTQITPLIYLLCL